MRTQSLFSRWAIVLTTGLLVTSFPQPDFLAHAQTRNEFNHAIAQRTPNRGRVPGRYRGAGRRDNCPAVTVPLTAIVPYQQDASQTPSVNYVGGTTTAERPTLWFYVPYALNENIKAEFILQDSNNTPISPPTLINVTDTPTPGVIRLTLPPLEVGKTYQWYFKVFCGSEVPTYTNGGIERIPLDAALAQQLAAASPQDKAKLYQANELWYDAINVLGENWRSRPNDPTALNAWKEMLRSLNLEDVANHSQANE